MPVSDLCDADIVTQGYGCTDNTGEWYRPDCPGGYFHAGIDLGYSDGGNNHLGSPIRSPRNGVVVAVGIDNLGPYAPGIRTDAEGVYVELGHVQAVYANVGDRVTAGQHVADLGTLGASTAGHLHLEVRTDGAVQGPPWDAVLDPSPWLHYLPGEVPKPAPTIGDDAMRFLSVERSDGAHDHWWLNSDGTLSRTVPEQGYQDRPPGTYQTLSEAGYNGGNPYVRGLGLDGHEWQTWHDTETWQWYVVRLA
jgi:peptidase M23-like protein